MNKWIWRLGLAALWGCTGAVQAQDRALSVQLGEMRYRSVETGSNGATLNSEAGRLPSVTALGAWRRQAWQLRLSHQIARGELAYQGYTQMGIPLATNSQLVVNKSAVQVGREWAVNDCNDIVLLAGLERLSVDRNILPAMASLPLREKLSLVQAAIGLQWAHAGSVRRGWSWDAGAFALAGLQSRLQVDSYGLYDTVTLQPARAVDWRAEAGLLYRWSPQVAASLRLGHETATPGASSQDIWYRAGIPAAGVRYPGSRQSLTTLQAGFTWTF